MASAQDLLNRHPSLNHLESRKVSSHVQRPDGEWVRHTLMLEGLDVPFVFRRQKPYRSLIGARVNLTYYRQTEEVAGIEFESMKVVRIKRA
ncbi:hypothetical protein DXV75_03720 [Alteromonas aestuariivivens]|uniref:Uncharacterized protein n=1 Tax=Alteromonas aestuariivivens TaxID=1938339 RepID=A0A3D8MC40_9ALTE|nr:hypothetical protein [Alteromonas aestuariivivens]RDV28084.1 hypothetical protein DXV75_03720 [Alteromonas aestuariivivens]